jgi:hypothetical protein
MIVLLSGHLSPRARDTHELPHQTKAKYAIQGCPIVSCFRSQNLQEPKIDGYLFWDQNLWVVLDASLGISSTGIDKIRDLSIIYIQIIFLIFNNHRANRPWLKPTVIHATK